MTWVQFAVVIKLRGVLSHEIAAAVFRSTQWRNVVVLARSAV
jgi:hypothetical protein